MREPFTKTRLRKTFLGAALFASATLMLVELPGSAQSMNMQQMENALNKLDPTPSLPVVAPNTVAPNSGQFPYPTQPQYSYTPVQQQAGYSFPGQPLVGVQTTQAPAQQMPMQSQAPLSPLRALFAGSQPKPTPPPKPVTPLQYVMQQFLGNGSSSNSSSGSNSANDQQKTYNAREYLQTANNEASKAYNACERASYGSDKYARKQAAQEAYYAAQAAHYAANNATSAAAGGPSSAQDAAAQARDAADRAQASADRASSNANNGGGW